MSMRSALVAAGILVAIHAGNAFAQSTWRLDAYAGVTPSVRTGVLDLDDASANTSALYGISVQRATRWRHFAVEADLRVVPGFLQGHTAESLVTRSRLMILSGSLIAGPRSSDRVRPYAALGLSSVHYAMSDRLSALEQRSRLLGIVGAGGVSLLVASPLSIRGELRYLRTQRSALDGVFEDAFIDVVQLTVGGGVEW